MTAHADVVGIRAFMIVDVRGYTSFTVMRGDEAAAGLAVRFAELVRAVVEPLGGEVVELRGDEALVSFASSRQAVRAGLEMQRAVTQHTMTVPEVPIGVGIGIDVGEAIPTLGGYRGKALNLAARLCSLAGVGEVLITESLEHLAGHVDGLEYTPRGEVQLKGFSEPVRVIKVEATEVSHSGLAQSQMGAISYEPPEIQIGVFLGELPGGVLVGRQKEMTGILTAIESVVAGNGQTLLLAGEPGSGKTRLTQECLLEVRNRGFVFGAGSFMETRQLVPYYAFLDILPSLVATYKALTGLDPTVRWPYLQRLVGRSGPVAEGTGGQAEEERVRREVTGFMSEMAAIRPIAVALDDLQWADDSSLALLHNLCLQTRRDRVLLIGTYRDVEIRREHGLEKLIRDLRREEIVVLLPVRRLSSEGTAALVAASFGKEQVSEEFAKMVHEQTDGNAFFVQQVLRTLVERGDVYREANNWGRRDAEEIEIPESIRSAIGERLSRLPTITQDALASAAVLGQRFDFNTLMLLGESEELTLEEALMPALRAGLLRAESGDRYAFDHALTRQTLLAEIPTRKRRRWHARAGAVLEQLAVNERGRAAEIAFHYTEADRAEPAARWSMTAADDALLVFAYPEAERYFQRAVEMAEAVGEADLRARALLGLGMVLRIRGRHEEALKALEQAAERYLLSGEVESEAGVIAEIGITRGEWGIGISETIERIEEFMEGRGARVVRATRARVLTALNRLLFRSSRFQQLLASATEVEALTSRGGDTMLRAEAMGRRANAIHELGDSRAARDVFQAALNLVDETVPNRVTATLLNNLAYTEFCLGNFGEHLRRRQQALVLAEAQQIPGMLAFALAMVAQAEYYLGELSEAATHSGRAVELAGTAGTSMLANYVATESGVEHFARGERAEAERLVRAGYQAAVATEDHQLGAWSAQILCEVLLERGEVEEAGQVASDELKRGRTVGGWRWIWPLIGLAQVELARGQLMEAEAQVREAIAECEARVVQPEMVDGLRILGTILGAVDAFEEAEIEFAKASKLAEAMPYPLAVAKTRLARARMLVGKGDATGAGREVVAAQKIIETHGFAGLTDEAGNLAYLSEVGQTGRRSDLA